MTKLVYNQVTLREGKIILDDVGCGCCGGDKEVTPEELSAYICELETVLSEARTILKQFTDPEAGKIKFGPKPKWRK